MKEAIRALNLALRGHDAPRSGIEYRAAYLQLMDAGEAVMAAYGAFLSQDTITLEQYKESQLRTLDAIDKATKRAEKAEKRVAELTAELQILRNKTRTRSTTSARRRC